MLDLDNTLYENKPYHEKALTAIVEYISWDYKNIKSVFLIFTWNAGRSYMKVISSQLSDIQDYFTSMG